MSWNSIWGNRHNWKATYICCYFSWDFVKFKKQRVFASYVKKMPFILRTKSNNSATAEVKIAKIKRCHIFINHKVIQKLVKFAQSKNQSSWALWVEEQQHIIPCVWRSYLKNKMQKNLTSQLLKCSFIWFEKSLWYTSIHLVAYTNEDHMDYAYRPRNP